MALGRRRSPGTLPRVGQKHIPATSLRELWHRGTNEDKDADQEAPRGLRGGGGQLCEAADVSPVSEERAGTRQRALACCEARQVLEGEGEARVLIK